MDTLFADRRGRMIGAALGFLLTILSIFFIAKTITEFKQGRVLSERIDAPTINVTGEGKVTMTPDMATFSFSMREQNKQVSQAQKVVAEKINKAMDVLKESGIDEKDIKTQGYNTYPRYNNENIVCITYPCNPGNPVLVGYDVSQTIEVKIKDLDKVGDVVARITELGVDTVSGITFDVQNKEEVMRDARKKAIDDAKEKAKVLARDLDVRLVRIVSFNEGGQYPVPYFRDTMATSLESGKGGVVAPQIPAGENEIVSNVSIVYEIR